ncbi:hypothetical protein PWY87_29075 [Kribbella solani]|uniref:hypothetical protein n=1 Tax=Kribbella solani TaxID=236067 RepID=UPI0029A90D44|nr:hypothetical protein [Kribbella solani]MDX3005767.1 hypothetical protein [Kribbella solani]
MRPVQPCATERVGAVPSARASLQGSRRALSTAGLRAMTAALVIVPTDPARLASVPAQRGRKPRIDGEPQEVPNGAPWMVRLSMGSADVMLRVTSAARRAPARKHPLGSHR